VLDEPGKLQCDGETTTTLMNVINASCCCSDMEDHFIKFTFFPVISTPSTFIDDQL